MLTKEGALWPNSSALGILLAKDEHDCQGDDPNLQRVPKASKHSKKADNTPNYNSNHGTFLKMGG